jgi:hypothetical protein
MRPFYVAVLLGALIAGIAPCQVFATGNVLVPSGNGGNSSGPANLGLVPQTNSSPASPQSPTSRADQTMSLPYTPMPQTSGQDMPAMPPVPPTTNETRVLKMPALAPPMSTAGGMKANSVTIEAEGGWNPSSVKRVSDQLGIPADKVASTCQQSLGGIIVTDKGSSSFYSNGSTHALGSYDGQIKNLMISPIILCNTTFPVPPNRGVILQEGDKYLVNPGLITCHLPANMGTPSKILITGGPGGTVVCKPQ